MPRLDAFHVSCSTFHVRPSTFDVQRSTSTIHYSLLSILYSPLCSQKTNAIKNSSTHSSTYTYCSTGRKDSFLFRSSETNPSAFSSSPSPFLLITHHSLLITCPPSDVRRSTFFDLFVFHTSRKKRAKFLKLILNRKS